MGLVGSEACMWWLGLKHACGAACFFYFNPEWSAQHSWERKAAFTEVNFLLSFYIVMQRRLLSCLICRLMPGKDFLQHLVDQSLSGDMMAHHPDTFQCQQMPLL